MNKSELQKKLQENHLVFIEKIRSLSEDEFLYSPEGKWAAGQQLAHIIKSVSPVNLAFSLPAFLIKLIFGKANRSSRTYDALVEKYKLKLSEGGKAPGRFVPQPIEFIDRKQLTEKLQQVVTSLSNRVNHKSEHELDTMIIPHPLLGKLTFREMIYFSIYHVEHHHKSAVHNLSQYSQ